MLPICRPPQIYEAIATKLPIGFSLVDQDGLILDFNPAAEKITGFLKKDILGKPHLEIIHGSSDAQILSIIYPSL